LEKITVKIINSSSNPLPSYATKDSAGMDLRANLNEPISLQPMERAAIPTGLYIELPTGFEAQIRPRSGLAISHGITCLNSPGTIDADYRGEIKIILINLSAQEHTVHHGDRIAQMVVHNITNVRWQPSLEISDTQRGTGGFGHTGKS
jgi:dUTP pyrophosphatase